MATTGRRTNPAVKSPLDNHRLQEEGYRFEFFQAVRLLERLFRERAPVGGESLPRDEVVKFRVHQSLCFPPSPIHDISPATNDGDPAQMTVAFFGLTGPLGVLPRHYTELLVSRQNQKKDPLRDFFDLLNHRLLSLFYRAWEKYRFPIGYERAVQQGDRDDSFSLALFDLMGMGTAGLRERLDSGDEALLFYSGLLAQRPHSASALQAILQDFFRVPVAIESCVGQWLAVVKADRTRIGTQGANHRLGESAMAGAQVWDQQAKFLLRVGPLSFNTFCDFLPNGRLYRQFMQLVRFIVGQEFDFDVQLILKAVDVPDHGWLKPGQRPAEVGPSRQTLPSPLPRLGWTTWLGATKFTHDANDLVLCGGQTKIGVLQDECSRVGGEG